MSESAQFHRLVDSTVCTKDISLSWRFLREFLLDGRTPARALTDEAVVTFMPFLEGSGRIVELGAAGNYYRQYASPSQSYLTTNNDHSCDLCIDMTKMHFKDSSIDALISIFVLEHVYDFDKVFRESFRCLKPNGRLLLIVPFLYFFHAAPDDFFRFTASALDRLLGNFTILLKKALGSRELLVAELYHEKTVMGSRRSVLGRVFLRFLALPFLCFAIARKRQDPTYAVAHVYLCEKPANHKLQPRCSDSRCPRFYQV